ncbi:unnamed protein product [Protopolystoma xenopodis]|uniref:Death domain-containing protein n=1 Tax=Protopolystoma xenopodis TaxID=117903 RepID=A0A448WJS6_9PLAT|nr:unnamed protein product [Protopolystoma xenopodis]
MAGNLIPILKTGQQLHLDVRAFQENRLTFPIRIREPTIDGTSPPGTGKLAFFREPRSGKMEPSSLRPITTLEVRLPGLSVDLLPCEAEDIARSDLDYNFLACHIGSDWPRLAAALGFSVGEIQEMQTQVLKSGAIGESAEVERAKLMILRWESVKRKEPESPAHAALGQNQMIAYKFIWSCNKMMKMS